jgi:ABC-type transporter Mla MlaB component
VRMTGQHNCALAQGMLRISIQDEPNQITFRLEGSLSGIWVTELEDSWRAATHTLAGRTISVCLAEVEHVDDAGKYLLALLRYYGARLSADGIEMSELVRKVAEDWPTQRRKIP